MDSDAPPTFETDPRFPSGPWTGFFLQKSYPGRHLMELRLTFQDGAMTGDGRDWVGPFHIKGRYSTADGKCHWAKKYVGKHDVFYQGFNEGKGIWGVWEITPKSIPGDPNRGGFHIWPEGFGDPTNEHLVAAADLPISQEELVEVGAARGAGGSPARISLVSLVPKLRACELLPGPFLDWRAGGATGGTATGADQTSRTAS